LVYLEEKQRKKKEEQEQKEQRKKEREMKKLQKEQEKICKQQDREGGKEKPTKNKNTKAAKRKCLVEEGEPDTTKEVIKRR